MKGQIGYFEILFGLIFVTIPFVYYFYYEILLSKKSLYQELPNKLEIIKNRDYFFKLWDYIKFRKIHDLSIYYLKNKTKLIDSMVGRINNLNEFGVIQNNINYSNFTFYFLFRFNKLPINNGILLKFCNLYVMYKDSFLIINISNSEKISIPIKLNNNWNFFGISYDGYNFSIILNGIIYKFEYENFYCNQSLYISKSELPYVNLPIDFGIKAHLSFYENINFNLTTKISGNYKKIFIGKYHFLDSLIFKINKLFHVKTYNNIIYGKYFIIIPESNSGCINVTNLCKYAFTFDGKAYIYNKNKFICFNNKNKIELFCSKIPVGFIEIKNINNLISFNIEKVGYYFIINCLFDDCFFNINSNNKFYEEFDLNFLFNIKKPNIYNIIDYMTLYKESPTLYFYEDNFLIKIK